MNLKELWAELIKLPIGSEERKKKGAEYMKLYDEIVNRKKPNYKLSHFEQFLYKLNHRTPEEIKRDNQPISTYNPNIL